MQHMQPLAEVIHNQLAILLHYGRFSCLVVSDTFM